MEEVTRDNAAIHVYIVTGVSMKPRMLAAYCILCAAPSAQQNTRGHMLPDLNKTISAVHSPTHMPVDTATSPAGHTPSWSPMQVYIYTNQNIMH